ncbi:MAG: DUF5709 domain-containing protein [Pseudonocardia sp.]|nr:DUF5709 domain-containing protein [Pseudonocardia sp.]
MAQQRETQDDEFTPAADMAGAMQLDTEETLVGPPGADPLDAGYVPPDRPYAAEATGVTPAEQREGESHEERLRREVPEGLEPVDATRTGRLEADGTTDGDATDVGVDGGAASAEEAAMHDVDNGIEPVVDETPAEDPEVTASLEADPHPDEALADAVADGRDDPDFGPEGRVGSAGSRMDGLPEAGGAAAAADGRTDAGPGAFGR